MKNFMVANHKTKKRYGLFHYIETNLKAQIANSIDLGWRREDIVVLSNFEYEFMGVKNTVVELNDNCLTGSKMFGLKWLYENTDADVVWSHDLDAWQNAWFDAPDFKDVGATYYSQPKFNGGSMFWRRTAVDIIEAILGRIKEKKKEREEPAINHVFKSKKYKDRITTIDNTFNVGCSGFVERYVRSMKPIRVCHFHPYNRIAWETHALDRNGIGEIPITPRLECLIREYYGDLATELSEEGKKSRTLKKDKVNNIISKQEKIKNGNS